MSAFPLELRTIPIEPLYPAVEPDMTLTAAISLVRTDCRLVLFVVESRGDGAIDLLGMVPLLDLLAQIDSGRGDRPVRELVKPVDRVVRLSEVGDLTDLLGRFGDRDTCVPVIGATGECLGAIDGWQLFEWWCAQRGSDAIAQGSGKAQRESDAPHAAAPLSSYAQTIDRLEADIASRKLLEEKLASSYTQMQALFDVMQDVAAIVATTDDGFGVNILSASLFEDPDPIRIASINHTIAAFVEAPATSPLHQSVWRALREGKTTECAYEFSIDGHPVYFEALVSPIFSTSVLWLARDITELKNTEQALKASQGRFRYLLTSNPAVVYTCSPDDRAQTMFIGDNIRDLLGYRVATWTENPDFFYERLHPDDRGSLEAGFAEARARGHAVLEYRFCHADGHYCWLRDELKLAIAADDNTPLEYIGSLTDISDRKRAEAEVFKSLEKERELSDLKSRFVSMASHEFRTPLAIIQSSAQLLERYELESNEKQEQFVQIHDSIQHMNQLLTDVLTLGRAEAGKLAFQPEPVPVMFFCQNLVERLRVALSSHQIALAFDDRIDTATMFDLDAKLLRQILTNLVSNAVKYSPEADSVDLEVTLDADGSLCLRVRDRGIGIPASDLPRLCSSFHRAGNVGMIQGTGLGLAIVQRCVSLHGGTIDFKSQVDYGTSAIVRIPHLP